MRKLRHGDVQKPAQGHGGEWQSRTVSTVTVSARQMRGALQRCVTQVSHESTLASCVGGSQPHPPGLEGKGTQISPVGGGVGTVLGAVYSSHQAQDRENLTSFLSFSQCPHWSQKLLCLSPFTHMTLLATPSPSKEFVLFQRVQIEEM